jgi:hypothetical protein
MIACTSAAAAHALNPPRPGAPSRSRRSVFEATAAAVLEKLGPAAAKLGVQRVHVQHRLSYQRGKLRSE